MTDVAERRWEVAVIALLGLSFVAIGLADHHLLWPDEPRVAGIAREMTRGTSWAIPTLGGRPFLEQPPLAYAAIAASLLLIGPAEWAARLPSVAWGLVGAAAVGLLTAGLHSHRRAGVAAGAALLLTVEHWKLGHRVMVDAPLAAFVGLSVWLLQRAAAEPGRRVWFPLAGLAVAGAFLCKGAIGLVFPTCAFVGLLAWRGWGAVLRRPWTWTAPALCVAAIVPWLLAMFFEAGWEPLRVVFVDNHLKRFLPGVTSTAYAGGHEGGAWYYYLERLPVALLPTLLALPAAIAWHARGWRSEDGRGEAARLALAWLGLGLLFLSAAGTKRQNYVLPIVPAAAVLVGSWLGRLRDDDALTKLERGTLALLGAAAPLAPTGVLTALAILTRSAPPPGAVVAAAAATVTGGLGAHALWRGRRAAFLPRLGVAAALTWAAAGLVWYPHADRTERHMADFMAEARRRIPKAARLMVVFPIESVLGSASFYLDRSYEVAWTVDEAAAFLRQPGEGWLVIAERAWEGKPQLLPAIAERAPLTVVHQERRDRHVASLVVDHDPREER